ncbi:hypothetical protein N177_2521 [Lutibaculum baratangense AMV1]|uniref:Uncharacterized protein n=2 Tax=Lutibaculum TaxID=1358438 RepID=V4QWF3_9HYPH|nr:hypothetical protein N177_2521 [Lutibaculum baratangense AMV1]
MAGFSLVTRSENASVPESTVILRYEGPIDHPMADDLQAISQELGESIERVILELDSVGGELNEASKVIDVLADMRARVTLKTLVRQGRRCLSACVLVFMQAETRVAGGASAWMFHGACPPGTNVPSLTLTARFTTLLRDAGVDPQFIRFLVQEGCLDRPGGYWASGYELFHVHKANIITRLLDPWEPLSPSRGVRDPQIQPR